MSKHSKKHTIREHNWSKDREERCKIIGTKAAAFIWMHNKTAHKYSFWNRVFLFVMLIGGYLFGTSGAGISGLATHFQDTNAFNIVQIVISVLVLCLGIIGTVHTFLGYDEKIGKQRWASGKNTTIYLNIKKELAKSRKDRHDYHKFYKEISTLEFKIKNDAPIIPSDIIKNYYKTFGDNAISQDELFNLGDEIVIAPEDESDSSEPLKTKAKSIRFFKAKSTRPPQSAVGLQKAKSKKDYTTFKGKGAKLTNRQRYELEKYFLD